MTTITRNTMMRDTAIVFSSDESLLSYLNSGRMCDERSIQEISSHLAYAEKLDSPEMTVHQFLSGIASSTVEISSQDIDEIISEGDYLGVVEMMIHTFEVEHICSYVTSKFG